MCVSGGGAGLRCWGVGVTESGMTEAKAVFSWLWVGGSVAGKSRTVHAMSIGGFESAVW